MPLKIIRNDITKMNVDVVVNTANEAPIYSDGVDTAIYYAAGKEELLAKRREIGWMKEGEVAITPGFNLPAKYIIHAVSPRYINGTYNEEEKLRDCYRRSLRLAYEYGCESIAFPLISTGCFGYSKEEGLRVALDEIKAFLMKSDMLVYLVVFDTESTRLGINMYPGLEEYIDQKYVNDKIQQEYCERTTANFATHKPRNVFSKFGLVDRLINQSDKKTSPKASSKTPLKTSPKTTEKNRKSEDLYSPEIDSCSLSYDDYENFLEEKESALEERMKHLSDTFQQYLLFLMDEKGLTPSQVYKRAIITKQLFSKIKLNPDYHPDKATAMRLCVGAKLNLDETKDLLGRAGYALSPCDKRDIVFSFFIENNVHDMIEIDIALEEHGLPCFIE